VYKPRTQPEAFQGMGAAGLALVDEARRVTGLPVIAEPLDTEQVGQLRAHVDALMIGARSMHNTPLLRAAARSGLPVIVKRGMSATIDEWLAAARYVLVEGNDSVILCERGIRTFESYTRNTLDLSAIPVVKALSHLPIVADPSHGTGLRDKVAPMGRAAIAAGGDGLLIEVHDCPEKSLSDGAQSLYPQQFAKLMDELRIIAPAVGRKLTRQRSNAICAAS
jgi:3-deoxy-7-phosphoheptulonate synthase